MRYGSVLLLLISVSILLFGDDEFLERVKKAYGFDEWKGRDGALKQGIPLRKMDFSPYKVVSERHTLPTSGVITLRYGKDKMVIFEVSVKVCDSVIAAQEELLRFLANCTVKVPTGSSLGLTIGDVCYAAKKREFFKTVAFVRNNIFIRVYLVRIEETSPNIAEIAEKIDDRIKSEEEVKKPEELSKPSIELSVAEDTVKSNAPVEVILKIDDPKKEKVEIYIDEGGGMVYKEEDKLYFKAEKEGEYKVTVYAINEHFLISRRSITIRVVRE